jgi:protein phosphatase
VTDDGKVAVFQGIPGKIAGFDLSTIDFTSETKIDDLTPVAQKQVREGIPSASEAEARAQLQTLLDPSNHNVLPTCPASTQPVTTTPPPTSPGPKTSTSPKASAPPVTTPPVTDSAVPIGPPDCKPASN